MAREREYNDLKKDRVYYNQLMKIGEKEREGHGQENFGKLFLLTQEEQISGSVYHRYVQYFFLQSGISSFLSLASPSPIYLSRRRAAGLGQSTRSYPVKKWKKRRDHISAVALFSRLPPLSCLVLVSYPDPPSRYFPELHSPPPPSLPPSFCLPLTLGTAALLSLCHCNNSVAAGAVSPQALSVMFIIVDFPSPADRRRGPIPPRLRRTNCGGRGARERAVRRRVKTSFRIGKRGKIKKKYG